MTVRHTPDFFVIRTDGIVWEEWKPAEALPALATRMPHRYVPNADGTWCCPPGEQAVAPCGGTYRVRTSAEIDWVLQRNLRFLEDYLRSDCPVVADLAAHILEQHHTSGCLTLAALLATLPSDAVDALYTLIATEQIALDLSMAPLAEPERVVLHPGGAADSDPLPSGAGCLPPMSTPVLWDGVSWLVINTGTTTLALVRDTGTLTHLDHATFLALHESGLVRWQTDPADPAPEPAPLITASPAAWHEAYRRYQLLAPILHENPTTQPTVSARTVRRWLARYRAAERDLGCGYLGLLPQRQQRGNRTTRLPTAVQTLMDQVITTHYERPQRASMRASYAILCQECQRQQLPVPSYKTFVQAVHHRPRTEQVRKRQGDRAAYQQQPFYWELTAHTPRHGDRPGEIGHIDHTELDIMLVCSRTGQVLGRPWLTLLLDACSRRILGVCLTYDPPAIARACSSCATPCAATSACPRPWSWMVAQSLAASLSRPCWLATKSPRKPALVGNHASGR